ncbi:MAG: CRISPR-associated helicase Cas3' [Candidatus Lokiarchaeota archaeon]|nr:CRISPR-associated helicase Cas3' [Candidatus Harpocratesius repetitus]
MKVDELLAKSIKISKKEDGSEEIQITTLHEHTAAVMETVQDIFNGLPQSLKERHLDMKYALIVAALFHDLGKAHLEFQKLLQSEQNRWNQTRHEIISVIIFENFIINNYNKINASSDSKIGRIIYNYIIEIWLGILLHHKGIIPSDKDLQSRKFHKWELLNKVFGESLKPMSYIKLIKPLEKNLNKFKSLFNEIWRSFIEVLKNDGKISDISDNFEFCPLIPPKNFSNLKFKKIMIAKIFNNSEEIESDNNQTELVKKVDQINILRDGLKENFQHKIFSIKQRINASIFLGILKSADHMASAGYKTRPILVFKEFQHKNKLYPFQERLSKITSNCILRAPTGSGKTAASIAWCQTNQVKNGRLFYILPFQSSINAMFQTLLDFFSNGNKISNINYSKKELSDLDYTEISVGLCHSSNLEFLASLFENGTEDHNSSSTDPSILRDLTREIFYPIKVTTPHQLLRLMLLGRGWEQQLPEVIQSVVVFDEIHAYNPHLFGLICGLIRMLRKFGAKILIMTATMPSFMEKILKQELSAPINDQFSVQFLIETNNNEQQCPTIELDPKNEIDKKILNKLRHKISVNESDILSFVEHQDNIRKIVDNYNQGYSQLFIVNTIGTAQRLYSLLKDVIANSIEKEDELPSILLFHSRFTREDRYSRIQSITDPNTKPLILVATQVVEVSLDIDYKFGYIENAPLDSLVQRFGRINRKGKNSISTDSDNNIIVFSKTLNDSRIYKKEKIEATRKELKKIENQPLTEMHLKAALDNVYPSFTAEDEQEFKRGLNHPMISKFNQRFEVGRIQDWIYDAVENIETHLEVVPQEKWQEFWFHMTHGRYIKAQSLRIPINRKYNNNALKKKTVNHKDFYKIEHEDYKYSSEYGLVNIKRFNI